MSSGDKKDRKNVRKKGGWLKRIQHRLSDRVLNLYFFLQFPVKTFQYTLVKGQNWDADRSQYWHD